VRALPAERRGSLAPDALHERLRNALASRGIAVLDLQPILADAAKSTKLFFGEGHLNQAGHGVVAGALDRALREHGWLRSGPAAPPVAAR
jgi:hypothetical protein